MMILNKTRSSLILPLLLAALSVQAQVNTESMRKQDLEPGSHFTVGTTLSFIQGNSTILQSRIQARYDHVFEKGRVFLIGNHKISSKDDQIFINQGFGHLRYVKPLRAPFEVEIFIQQEFNEFINLQSRSLVGAGSRTTFGKPAQDALTVVWGLGLMLEDEQMDAGPLGILGDPVHGEEARLLRASNYLVLKWKPSDMWSLASTSYYQVDTQRIADFRILSQSQANIKLTDRLALSFSLNLRYDSEPPANIKDLDLEFSQGLTYSFK